MTITVQMLQTRKGPAGADLLVGNTYDLANDLAIQLVGSKFATDVHNVITLAKDANANQALAATAAQVAALAAAGTPVPAGTLLRSSATSVVYGQSDGLGGYTALGGSGGGVGGGGSDRTAVTAQADPVNGGLRVGAETVDGIPWTYSYDVTGNLINRAWAAGGLSADIDIDVNGFGIGDPLTNIFQKGGAIRVFASQMAALKAALTALAAPVSAQFFVVDFNSSNGLLLEWNDVDDCFRAPGGAEIWTTADYNTVAGADAPGTTESGALYAAVIPAWLRGPRSIVRAEYEISYTGVGENKRTRIKVNGTEFSNFTSGTVTHISFSGDAEMKASSATNFLFVGSTVNISSGGQITTSGVYSSTTITATTDLTLTLTAQYVTTGGAGSAWTGRMFNTYIRNR
jgi:YD repeat-containing protein